MSNRKLYLIFISITFFALLLLLYFQIKILLQTADTEKKHFKESVKLALSLAAEQISTDRQVCFGVKKCYMKGESDCLKSLHYNQKNKIDSILKSNLQEYNIDINYTFQIVNTNAGLISESPEFENDKCFVKSLDHAFQQAGVQLRVRFPDKNKFILQKITHSFIISVLLILLVMISFIITLKMYLYQQKISERTKDFINNMIHEFKTPLANIGFAGNRIKNSKTSENQEKNIKYLNIIENEKNKLLSHIDEILNVAVVENKNNMGDFEKISINELINSATENFKELIIDKKGEINIVFKCDICFVNGNKQLIINALSNILDNAVKYSTGDPKIKIIVSKFYEYVICEFIDNGIGINKKYQKNIFEKYFRIPTGNIHNIKGFGIGLAYVKAIVELHAGKIEIESEEDKGSNFKILLPLWIEK